MAVCGYVKRLRMYSMYIIYGDASGDVAIVCFKVDLKSMKGLLKQLYVQYYYSVAD